MKTMRTMKTIKAPIVSIVLIVLIVFIVQLLPAHDLFIKLDRYRVPPHTDVLAPVLNGTFSVSENAITRDRVGDVSLVGPAGRTRLDTSAVRARNDTTLIAFRSGEPGTYVLGFSTRPRELKISGEEFTAYLEEEGLSELIAERQRAGISGDSASERYSKHVKAVFQVGDGRTTHFGEKLGYPAELVPLENPAGSRTGMTLRFQALVEGNPAAGVVVLAGGRLPNGARIAQTRHLSDGDGIVVLTLTNPGRWYAKFIRIAPATGVDYESVWATVTWEVMAGR